MLNWKLPQATPSSNPLTIWPEQKPETRKKTRSLLPLSRPLN
jgi:hypothetical protein